MDNNTGSPIESGEETLVLYRIPPPAALVSPSPSPSSPSPTLLPYLQRPPGQTWITMSEGQQRDLLAPLLGWIPETLDYNFAFQLLEWAREEMFHFTIFASVLYHCAQYRSGYDDDAWDDTDEREPVSDSERLITLFAVVQPRDVAYAYLATYGLHPPCYV